MPTLLDLSELLAERAERSAPDQHAVLARLELRAPRRSRTRFVVPLLAAAAVVALAVGAMTFLGASGNTADRSAGRAVPPRHVQWRFSIGAVQGWTVQRVSSMWMPNNAGTSGDWGQAAELTPTRGRYRVIYGREPTTVRYPGNLPPNVGAHAVVVAGSTGVWVPGRHVDTASLAAGVRKHPWEAVTASGDPQPSLRWRNSDGSWNMLIGTVGFRPRSLDFDNAVAKRAFLRIAAAVTVATSTHYVAMPFHVALSPRFRPTEMNSTRGVSCASWTTTDAVVRSADSPPTAVTVCRAPESKLGDPAVPDQHALRRAIGDGTVLVIGVDPQLVSAAAERRILDSAKPSSSMTDETTWLPV